MYFSQFIHILSKFYALSWKKNRRMTKFPPTAKKGDSNVLHTTFCLIKVRNIWFGFSRKKTIKSSYLRAFSQPFVLYPMNSKSTNILLNNNSKETQLQSASFSIGFVIFVLLSFFKSYILKHFQSVWKKTILCSFCWFNNSINITGIIFKNLKRSKCKT